MSASPAPGSGYDTSRVPAHVKRSAEQGERALALMREGKDPRDPKAWETPKDQAQQSAQEPQQALPANPPPQQAAPEQKPSAAPQEPLKGQDGDWEQRYKSLDGQFQQQQRQIRGLMADLDATRTALSTLERQQSQPEKLPGGQSAEVALTKILSDAEREEWGPELLGVIDKVSKARIAALQDRLNHLEGTTKTIATHDAMSREQRMKADIDEAGIDFDQLNADQDFIDWINKIDEGSGKLRRTLLQDAWNNAEGRRVVYFSKQFLREVRGTEPEAQPLKDNGKGRAAAPQAKGLEDMAAPGKGRVAAPPKTGADDAAPKTFTAKEYSDFYTAKSLGRLKMTTEEIASRAKELDDAYRDGRITPTPQS